jgi:hypothetical protein
MRLGRDPPPQGETVAEVKDKPGIDLPGFLFEKRKGEKVKR